MPPFTLNVALAMVGLVAQDNPTCPIIILADEWNSLDPDEQRVVCKAATALSVHVTVLVPGEPYSALAPCSPTS